MRQTQQKKTSGHCQCYGQLAFEGFMLQIIDDDDDDDGKKNKNIQCQCLQNSSDGSIFDGSTSTL